MPNPRPPVFDKPLEIVRPVFPPLEDLLPQFRTALAAGQVTNHGCHVAAFERCLEKYLGVPALAFVNGQIALMVMLRAAGLTGGEVIVPAMTFSATAHAVVWAGCTPVFADCLDDMSFTIDPADVERRITPETRAILAVDPYGIACDRDALIAIGRRHSLKVLFDSAPSFGTRVDGRPVGHNGDAHIFSFHATKAFNTMEGGCLASPDAHLIEEARALRNFGQRDGDCPSAGLNGKMMEICALMGIAQLATFDEAARTRRRAAERISAGLSGLRGLAVGRAPPGQEPVWLYLPVVLSPQVLGCDRDEVVRRLERENLRVRKYYSPACHQLAVYRRMRAQPVLPVAERLSDNVVALPIYNTMTDDECDGVVEAVRRAVGSGEGI